MLIYQALSQWRSLTGQRVDNDRVKTNAPLKLYIWPSGPKFPGPSLQGECLAALAYLTFLSPPTSDEVSRRLDWELVQSWDPGNSPTCEFPMLQCRCDKRVAGFSPIVGHLKACVDLGYGHGDLDEWMNDGQKADCVAWISYVFTHVTETIDLYLFVTSHNYSSTTRPAYVEFLPTFLNYVVPPAHCKTAESRTRNLDIVTVLETTVDDANNSAALSTRNAGVDPTAGFPEKFGFGAKKEGLSAAQKRIRLETMMTRWIEPLEELLGQKKFLLSDERLSSLDALVLGYFSLILDVEVPDRWASRILEDKFPKLVLWVRREAPGSFLKAPGKTTL